jgi:hypothetical protein
MSTATEFFLFSTSQAYRDDPSSVFEKAATLLASQAGHLA